MKSATSLDKAAVEEIPVDGLADDVADSAPVYGIRTNDKDVIALLDWRTAGEIARQVDRGYRAFCQRRGLDFSLTNNGLLARAEWEAKQWRKDGSTPL